MSTAIMSQNALYEFGDNFLKNGIISPDNVSGNHLAVDSTVQQMRLTLTRMASTPIGTSAANHQNLAMLLGNLTQQHHNHHHHHRRLERTQSAPSAPNNGGIITPPQGALLTTVNTSRYKTELCRPFEEFGVCKYGDKCQFAHGLAELRSLARHPKYKTELCRTYHTVGFCPYGPRCHFVHNQDEICLSKSPTTTPPPPPLSNGSSSANSAAMLMAAAVAAANHRSSSSSRPSVLSPSLSLDSPSSPCSLSQSPTSSMGSFFSSDPELHSPGPLDDQRLPVFNRLSTTQLLTLNELML